ncbi:hypothetical protein ASG67_02230 [Sphingomonas sp. Leaf339]|uniref:hypothetical protein n=1 Tax=Sphingomonas sp. Leaf339 TaxID=1736343 RepID=UPI0007001607|nr:hypothetical protein [Sphingomonas sp. Leaf339]KQU61984.1 hypothetical protein ASG67_02230 [Sphingomonas sp. Leaf339]
MDALDAYVAAALDAEVRIEVGDLAATLAAEPSVQAVLFYGSNLRIGSLDGVLDFYVLTAGPPERGLWPTVSYREVTRDGITLRAKIATMRLATFRAAASGELIDTTIWTRFVQPAALVWQRDDEARADVVHAIAAAAVTAARFAAALGPARGTAADYWRALFRQTYAAELRVEKSGREEQILDHGAGRYQAILPLAWQAGGIAFAQDGPLLVPDVPDRARILARWHRRRRAGKPLNIARLIRAAFTFDGAAAYGLWKVERHTGVKVALTPWRERHPIMSAPAVFWQVWRARR